MTSSQNIMTSSAPAGLTSESIAREQMHLGPVLALPILHLARQITREVIEIDARRGELPRNQSESGGHAAAELVIAEIELAQALPSLEVSRQLAGEIVVGETQHLELQISLFYI